MAEPIQCNGDIVPINVLEPVGNIYSATFQVFPLTFCFAAYGTMFVLFTLVNAALAIPAMLSAIVTRNDPWHRPLLYVLMTVAAAIRTVFGAISWYKLTTVSIRLDELAVSRDFFSVAVVPVNASADLVSSYVDVLLAQFWIQAAMQQPTLLKWPLPLFMVVSLAVFIIVVVVDNEHVQHYFDAALCEQSHDAQCRERSLHAGKMMWRYTLFYIGLLMTVTAVIHVISIINVLYVMVKNDLHRIPAMRPQIFRTLAIGGITATCCTLRGLMLVLRESMDHPGSPFFSGALSFNNPAFTLVYYVFVMNLPVIIVAVSFLRLHVDRFKTAGRALLARMGGDADASPDLNTTYASYWNDEDVDDD